MTDLINLFKEKADEFLAAINQKGGVRATIEGLRRQMAEADRRRAMGRVKSELRRLDRQISEMVTAVGVQAVALQEQGKLTSPELQPLCQHIIDLKATLSEQQAELAKLEASVTASAAASAAAPAAETPAAGATPCANCGRPVPAGATFCPYCGAAVAVAARGTESVTGAPATSPSATSPSAPSAGTPSQPAPPSSTATTPSSAPPPAAAAPSAAPEQPAPSPSRGAPASRAGAAPQAPAPGATCAYCGAPLKPGAKFCSKCGRAV